MIKTTINEQIELVEKYLEALKTLDALIDESGETKRGFKAKGVQARLVSRELGKTLVPFRKAFSPVEQ